MDLTVGTTGIDIEGSNKMTIYMNVNVISHFIRAPPISIPVVP